MIVKYSILATLALSAASLSVVSADCSNGVPRAFSTCGSEALSEFGDASPQDTDAWAQGALKNFLSKRNLDCLDTSKVNEVPITCRNRYEDRVWVLVLDVTVPCYQSDGPVYLQARIYDDGSRQDYDCVDDICNESDRRYCDDDDDDDDDK